MVISFFEKVVITALLIISVLVMQGCETNNYQFGDITKRIDTTANNYCTETNAETKLMLKATLNSLGVSVGFDFCTAYGVKTILIGGGSG